MKQINTIRFEFIIANSNEAVFVINGEQHIYTIEGINALDEMYTDRDEVIDELDAARAMLIAYATRPIR